MVSRYGAVGLACALLNIGIVWVGTERLRLPYPVAAGCTCLITIPLSYLLHRRVSFALPHGAQWREFARFVATQLSQFALGFLLMAAAIESLGWRPWVAMAIVSAAMMAYGFLASSTWVFRVWRGSSAAAHHPASGTSPRLLQVSAFWPAHGGGIEVVAGQLATRLAREGVEVAWMAGGRPEEMPVAPPAGLVLDAARTVDFVERRLGLPAPLWNAASLRRLWRRIGDCDVVQVHDYLYMPSLAAIAFARLRRRPVVLTQHIGDIAFDSRLARLVLRTLNRTLGRVVLAKVDQVVFVGRPVMDYFRPFVRFRRPPLLIANGVDHELYRPAADRASRAPGAPLEALFVGRFVEKKGLSLLRECADLPCIRWSFVGRGPLSPAEWQAGADRVVLRGPLAPAEVADAMRAADLLVLPSKGEGFPLVVQEALACGTPVLVSREVADAFPQTDARCVHAVDVEGEAAEAVARLRQALESLARAPAGEAAGREAAAALAAQWSWAGCVQAYQGIYRALLAPAAKPVHA
jgi:glycosyltransferase involved in cell wall biosynthesis/putative flippase GtrA